LEERLDISVIIPIRDGLDTLGQCLGSLKRVNFPDFEVIVVDDGSEKDCSEVVSSYGFRSIRLDKPSGVECARNKGTEQASGDILVFIDCDMIVPPDALHRIHPRFSGNHYAAVSGICGFKSPTTRLATLYKNLWMFHSYTLSPDNFDWFLTGIGAVKREVFFRLGGFDTGFHIKTGGGDLEFGRRLREAGERILLDKELRVQHLKRYSLWGLLRNDYNRSRGWFRLVARKRMIPRVMKDLRIANIYPAFIISVPVSLLLSLSLVLSPFFEFPRYTTAFLTATYLIANYRLFRFLRRQGGTGFLLKAIPLSFVDHLVSGLGVIRGCFGCLGSLTTRWLQKLNFRAKPRKDAFPLIRRENS
jgi:glycosyltransferase involved in cell wall biosynthesis